MAIRCTARLVTKSRGFHKTREKDQPESRVFWMHLKALRMSLMRRYLAEPVQRDFLWMPVQGRIMLIHRWLRWHKDLVVLNLWRMHKGKAHLCSSRVWHPILRLLSPIQSSKQVLTEELTQYWAINRSRTSKTRTIYKAARTALWSQCQPLQN